MELWKCSFHNVCWGFTSTGSPFPDPTRDDEAMITVQRHDDAHNGTDIQQLDPTAAHKTLGHWKEPAGRQYDQWEQLQRKCDKLATTAHNSPMNRKDAWVYYFAIFPPASHFHWQTVSSRKQHSTGSPTRQQNGSQQNADSPGRPHQQYYTDQQHWQELHSGGATSSKGLASCNSFLGTGDNPKYKWVGSLEWRYIGLSSSAALAPASLTTSRPSIPTPPQSDTRPYELFFDTLELP